MIGKRRNTIMSVSAPVVPNDSPNGKKLTNAQEEKFVKIALNYFHIIEKKTTGIGPNPHFGQLKLANAWQSIRDDFEKETKVSID